MALDWKTISAKNVNSDEDWLLLVSRAVGDRTKERVNFLGIEVFPVDRLVDDEKWILVPPCTERVKERIVSAFRSHSDFVVE